LEKLGFGAPLGAVPLGRMRDLGDIVDPPKASEFELFDVRDALESLSGIVFSNCRLYLTKPKIIRALLNTVPTITKYSPA
jgi:hypothetical protein